MDLRSLMFIPLALVAAAIIVPDAKVCAACPTQAALPNTSAWAIADLIQATICGPTTNIISQQSIPLTITTPGVYCLCETITSGPLDPSPISITATNDVFIDLNKHTIIKKIPTDGVDRHIINILGSDNVTVANGFLKGEDSVSPSGFVRCINITNSHGITIYNVHFAGLDARGVHMNGSSHCVFHDCIALRTGTAFFASGTCSNTVFRDCSAMETNEAGVAQSQIGFFIDGNSHSFFGCSARTCGAGFVIGSGGGGGPTGFDTVIEACVCAGCPNGTGNAGAFDPSPADNVVVRECIAQNTVVSEFSISGISTRCTFMNDTANESGFRGFFLGGGTTNSTILGCVSSNNVLEGYLTADGTTNHAFNCYAGKNGTVGFSGFTTPEFTISTLLSANYWDNVSFPFP